MIIDLNDTQLATVKEVLRHCMVGYYYSDEEKKVMEEIIFNINNNNKE